MVNNEWQLLKQIVIASNQDDYVQFYKLLEEHSLVDMPQCCHAAVTAIMLTKDHVAQYKDELLHFVEKINETNLDFRGSYRLNLLRSLLGMDDDIHDILCMSDDDVKSELLSIGIEPSELESKYKNIAVNLDKLTTKK
ncbi:hypothetical protein L5L78_08555 [Shewanella sp. SM34]|uniref:hypothetical protein n=1 Tax=unclassified Shewanella TaxID=196818 RepID=UPI0021D8D187|nr:MULTISPECIES: hypothetical protein [unclassified Shewanella]MCU8056251.1 hypothetical protein [Shewanella sp. SM35]MCU8065185.1 hypothetical protein [Shewanella sp. SM34]